MSIIEHQTGYSRPDQQVSHLPDTVTPDDALLAELGEASDPVGYNRVRAIDVTMAHLAVRDPLDVDSDLQRWIVDIRGQIERQDLSLPAGMTINAYVAQTIRELVPESVRESLALAFEERREGNGADAQLMRTMRELGEVKAQLAAAQHDQRALLVEKAKDDARLAQLAALIGNHPELGAQVRRIIDSPYVDPAYYVAPELPSDDTSAERRESDTGSLGFLRSATGALAKVIHLKHYRGRKAS